MISKLQSQARESDQSSPTYSQVRRSLCLQHRVFIQTLPNFSTDYIMSLVDVEIIELNTRNRAAVDKVPEATRL